MERPLHKTQSWKVLGNASTNHVPPVEQDGQINRFGVANVVDVKPALRRVGRGHAEEEDVEDDNDYSHFAL